MISKLVAGKGAEDVGQRLVSALGWNAMVVGAIVIGYYRECTRESTWEQLGTLKKFKCKIVVLYEV